MRRIIKSITPPFILKGISSLFYGWSGNYSSWEEAKKKTTGYDSDVILQKVKASLLKVKNGEAEYERDSVIFDKVSYSFPLLSALSMVALKNKNKLNVLDFGGSLGSSYYQNRKFFKDVGQFNWCIVEQHHFVEEGQKTFADNNLHFFYDVESCTRQFKIDMLLLSSVLQYLEEPFSFLDEILKKEFEYIMIDRTPLLSEGNDRITVQKVPSKIYEAKYPCRILNHQKLLEYISGKYDLVFEMELEERINIGNASFNALFFQRKK